MLLKTAVARWMESKAFSSIEDVRGRIDGRTADANLFERANYIRTLQSWTA